ncbi:PRK06851 family protein [Paenibacillus doosanensis]|uniref:PRK06851 family protein n=1 Tax=Paenibacillus doosanensis TaxID=1229154 RepID=UPI00218080B2|nr:PRK06851 family protein [Paenibacillus doosanensis]MCS7459160.1 PRK06851 family protein [Paenibacillus doosanensis]
MSGTITNFYAGGNTARGFANLFESSLQGLDRVYILKGGPGTGKSTLIRSIGSELAAGGYDIWFIHCASDNNSLDGVVVPELKLGIVDGTAPHVIEPRLPGAVEQYVNLGTAWDARQLSGRREDIAELNGRIAQTYESAYACFAEALRIHDEWEKIYVDNMDFQAADELTNEYTDILFRDLKLDKESRIDHRFLGAATPKGAVDFVPNLTEGLAKRYFVKGRPGSGKSTMLKKLAAAATQRGFDVEIYHCGFDPNSLDMVIVRELGFAIFDSTAPHEYFPERAGDSVIDMYAHCIKPGTDEEHAEALSGIKLRYSAKMSEAMQFLAQGKALRNKLEQIYIQSIDFRIVDRIRDEIWQEITDKTVAAD